MALLHLVRHGHAEAGWGAHRDPDLDQQGRTEAENRAAALAELLTPCRLISSPLARALQTAAPLAQRWDRDVEVVPALGEIPSPSTDLAERQAWLSGALQGRWGDLDESVARWRHGLVDAVGATSVDTVAFTHFVAINAAVGSVTGACSIVAFLPATASVTTLEVDAGTGSVEIVALGDESAPQVG